MYIAKKILIKSATSLIVGVTSAIGMRLGGVIWDGCVGGKICKTSKNSKVSSV